ncbi:MAG: 5-formyltetrahydrofolate cyclo-ligase [Verrucomicrobiota bacterium]
MSEEKTNEELELEILEQKRFLRSSMNSRRRGADPAWIPMASERIQDAIVALPEFEAARSVGAYQALPYEVQTRKIIETCWSVEKKVCVPAFNEGHRRYELTWIEPNEEMKPGRMNVSEPLSENRAGFMDVELLVVPALVYDANGGRLGHGGGHYDRILGAWSGFKVGIAFQFQIHDEVPMGAQDIPVDIVVTEQFIYRPEGRFDLTEKNT